MAKWSLADMGTQESRMQVSIRIIETLFCLAQMSTVQYFLVVSIYPRFSGLADKRI